MNDFDFDVMQKKRIARGAAHMKRGSKSTKCSLPSDHMTQAQWKRRNGPVSTYSLNRPMDWETFKSLPIDIQQSYVDALQNRFNVTAATISTELFGNTAPVLRLHMDKLGIKYIRMKGRGMTADEREVWERWLNPENPTSVEDYDAETEERMDDEPVEDPDVAEVVEGFKEWSEKLMVPKLVYNEEPDFGLDELSAVFSGEFDPDRFLRFMTQLPVPEGKVRIKVEVTRE
ncbi:MAG: hypothetical protein IKY91_06455 [Akkermansia sp.]|nr:hypothetical protein [Akkermansia sp.]